MKYKQRKQEYMRHNTYNQHMPPILNLVLNVPNSPIYQYRSPLLKCKISG